MYEFGEGRARVCNSVGEKIRVLSVAVAAVGAAAASASAQEPNISEVYRLDTVTVLDQRETAWGPVPGYIATRSGTGTKTDTPLKEIPQSISVVTADQVRDMGSTTVQETVRYVPGVYADAYGPDSRGDFPRIRGSDPNIFLDGTRVIDTFQFNQFRPDPYTLERIEVLRGPPSVLYGDSTTAGIVNLVSKRPLDEAHREIGVQYGSFDRKQVQFDMTGRLSDNGEWLYRLIGIFRDSGYQTDFVPDDRIAIAPAITWRPSANTTWTVLGTYQNDRSGSSTAFLPIEGTLYPGPNGRRIPINRFTSDPNFDHYQTETGTVSSLFEHAFSDTFKVRQNTRYVHTEGIYNSMWPDQYGADPGNPNYPFLDPSHRTVARFVSARNTIKDSLTSDTNAELKFATGPISHKLLSGFDYRGLRERAASGGYVDPTPFNLYAPVYTSVTPPTVIPEPDIFQSQTGFYLQDQMRLGPWITVLGIRHDLVRSKVDGSASQSDEATSMRAGLMYEFPSGLTPYISYTQSFNPIFGGGVCAELCKPMRGEQYEVGFKYQPSRVLAINGALYDILEKNRLAAGPDPDFSVQTGEVRIRGAELEVLASVTSNLDIIAAYSYTDARIVKGDNAGARAETVPLHQASLWGKYKFSMFGVPGFSVGAGVRYVGDSWDGVDKNKTPAYTLFDAMFAYENDKWRFQINGVNLTDKIHLTTCLARGDCFYGARRTILSSLTYKF